MAHTGSVDQPEAAWYYRQCSIRSFARLFMVQQRHVPDI